MRLQHVVMTRPEEHARDEKLEMRSHRLWKVEKRRRATRLRREAMSMPSERAIRDAIREKQSEKRRRATRLAARRTGAFAQVFAQLGALAQLGAAIRVPHRSRWTSRWASRWTSRWASRWASRWTSRWASRWTTHDDAVDGTACGPVYRCRIEVPDEGFHQRSSEVIREAISGHQR